MPVRNQADLLKTCLLGISRCEDTSPEVVVVDDGSSSDYAARIAAVTKEFGAKLVVLDRHRGPSAARNHGVQATSGKILVFLDSDVVPHKDCFKKIRAALRADCDLAAIVGSYDSAPSDPGFVSQYRNLLHSYIHHSSQGKLMSFWTGCGAIRREAFLAVGGFNEVYDRPSIEDVEFGVRLTANGQRILLDPSIEVCHQKGWTLFSMVETDFLYRALPWTVLAWSGAGLPSNLNFTRPRRISVAATFAASLLGALSPFYHHLHWLWMAAAVIVVILNLPFIQWLYRHKGLPFVCWALPLHWLHYLVSATGFICGTAMALKIWIESRNRGATIREWN